MTPKSLHPLMEARKLVAELGALLGGADPDDDSQTGREGKIPITASKTVRELALELPNATRIFEKFGIDHCCGGHKSLEVACATANVSLDDVARALEQGSASAAADRDWNTAPIADLVDNIVNKHHSYVKREVPRLEALMTKVVGVHGTSHPELLRVQSAFRELANELAAHLMKEEQILFPYLKQMGNGHGCGSSCFGSVQNPIRVMMMEHDGGGEKLREIRQATNNYAMPGDACDSYSTLFGALQEFEQDLHQHIHLEHNVLFPRALVMEM